MAAATPGSAIRIGNDATGVNAGLSPVLSRRGRGRSLICGGSSRCSVLRGCHPPLRHRPRLRGLQDPLLLPLRCRPRHACRPRQQRHPRHRSSMTSPATPPSASTSPTRRRRRLAAAPAMARDREREMRPLDEKEATVVLKKLFKFTGPNLKHIVERPAVEGPEDSSDKSPPRYCFRLNKNRVFYASKSLVRRSTNVSRERLVSVGSLIGKFPKSGQFRLAATPMNSTGASETTSSTGAGDQDRVQNHGVALTVGKTRRVKCNYCGKEVTGFSRLQHHLGHVGPDVTPCPQVSDDVMARMRSCLMERKKGKLVNEVGEVLHPRLPLKRNFVPAKPEPSRSHTSSIENVYFSCGFHQKAKD